jgi:hypothetical protein
MHVEDGVAKEFSWRMDGFDHWEPQPGREQLMADIAYCQWTPQEIAHGACLNHMIQVGGLCG